MHNKRLIVSGAGTLSVALLLSITATASNPASAATVRSTASAATVRSTASAAQSSTPLLHRDRQAGTQSSENWSGYIRSGASGAYTSTTATWTVPTLKTTYSGYSSTWVGIDGASSGDQYLIQTGTEADVVRGKATYDAWYEVITPTNVAPETLFSGFAVSPGNSITATVSKTSSTKWTMSLKNNSTGATASHSSTFAGPGQSAEWIQEDTDVNGYISAAPNWQSVHFSGITLNGANPNLAYSESVDIYDGNGTKEDNTAAPTGGNAFTVTWLAPGTRTYVG